MPAISGFWLIYVLQTWLCKFIVSQVVRLLVSVFLIIHILCNRNKYWSKVNWKFIMEKYKNREENNFSFHAKFLSQSHLLFDKFEKLVSGALTGTSINSLVLSPISDCVCRRLFLTFSFSLFAEISNLLNINVSKNSCSNYSPSYSAPFSWLRLKNFFSYYKFR